MREKIAQQAPLMPAPIAHKHARELQQMSEVLGQLPEVTELVHADLVRWGLNRIAQLKDRVLESREIVLRRRRRELEPIANRVEAVIMLATQVLNWCLPIRQEASGTSLRSRAVRRCGL